MNCEHFKEEYCRGCNDKTWSKAIRLLGPETNSLHGPAYLTSDLKRRTERFISAILGTFSSPVIVLAALSIFCQDGQNPIYIGNRPHLGSGEIIPHWKIRTMKPGAESLEPTLAAELLNGTLKLKGKDSRITLLGRIWRNTSVDEGPQLIQIALNHDLALVGPRTVSLTEYGIFNNSGMVPYLRLRKKLIMFPKIRHGLMSLTSACGRSELGRALGFCLENEYIDGASRSSDFRIMIANLGGIVRRTGAY